MKTKLHYKVIKCLCFFLAFSGLNTITAQTTHEVTVSDFKFDPAQLTIAPGDIVKWTNVSGTHSVDGTTATFPSNPASFGNDVAGPGWTYSFTFNNEGVYDYRCGLHTTTMTGKITVGTSTGLDNSQLAVDIERAYPNPVGNVLYIPLKSTGFENKLLTICIYNLNGKMVAKRSSNFELKPSINVKTLKAGVYVYQLSENEKIIQSEKFLVNK